MDVWKQKHERKRAVGTGSNRLEVNGPQDVRRFEDNRAQMRTMLRQTRNDKRECEAWGVAEYPGLVGDQDNETKDGRKVLFDVLSRIQNGMLLELGNQGD